MTEISCAPSPPDRSQPSVAGKPLAVLAYDETDAARLLYAAKALGVGAPQVAGAIAVRRSELDCLFREQLGHSVGEEVRRRRFARVKLLLETTRLSVAAIARETGYCTPSHLANAFKSAFGRSPKGWRKALPSQAART